MKFLNILIINHNIRLVLSISDDKNALEKELNTFVANTENSKLFETEKKRGRNEI